MLAGIGFVDVGLDLAGLAAERALDLAVHGGSMAQIDFMPPCVHTSMTRNADRLRHLEIASPCTVPWENMRGGDNIRFCGKCRLNVYNLSGMSRREAEAAVGRREGRVCVRFYRRPDGTVLTKECGARAAAFARKVSRLAFAAICIFIVGLLTGTTDGVSRWVTQFRWPSFLTPPKPGTPLQGEPAIMGDIVDQRALMGKIRAAVPAQDEADE